MAGRSWSSAAAETPPITRSSIACHHPVTVPGLTEVEQQPCRVRVAHGAILRRGAATGLARCAQEGDRMNLGELQAELRHFATERDWQPFTPKNLTTALAWSRRPSWRRSSSGRRLRVPGCARGCRSQTTHRRGEVATALLYLLQVADHCCQIDVSQAVQDKLARNGQVPGEARDPRVSPTRASVPGTHVLLDYENVQPSDAELRALVPDGPGLGVPWTASARGREALRVVRGPVPRPCRSARRARTRWTSICRSTWATHRVAESRREDGCRRQRQGRAHAGACEGDGVRGAPAAAW